MNPLLLSQLRLNIAVSDEDLALQLTLVVIVIRRLTS
jgi:hypothetical protein